MSEYEKKLNKKRALVNKHMKELSEIINQCPHENLEEKVYYYEGSYLDRAYTEYWKQCKVCGYKFKFVKKIHDYYG